MTVTSDELAWVLAQECVFSDTHNTIPGVVIDEAAKPAFQEKATLYRLALVLLVLMAEEVQSPKLLNVRISIERVFTAENGEDLLTQVRVAMERLHELFACEQPRDFTWSILWFSEIGVDETNFIPLMMLAKNWKTQFVAVTQFCRDCTIVDKAS